MLETIIVVLLALWALGFLGGFASGSLVHLLLVIALVTLIYRLASGRKLT